MRRSGYGVRHIWGHPWDPAAFTAGWNLAYMPFWAGMLTEDQHPHPLVQSAIKQAGWELFFRTCPVCKPPEFVSDQGLDLAGLLDGQPLLVAAPNKQARRPSGETAVVYTDAALAVKALRRERGCSWSNLRKAVRALQDLDHEPFSTGNVESNSKSHVRRMMRDTGLALTDLSTLIDGLAPPQTE